MRRIKNILVVLFSIFFLPLVYFAGEWFDILWLRVVSAILVIPVMIWWGAYGYNWVFGNKKKEEEEPKQKPDEA